jgi:hypothetical protein
VVPPELLAISSLSMPNGDVHIFVIGKDGRLYEAFRFTNNTWSGFTDVFKDARQPGGGGLVVPPELVAISSTSMPSGDVHIVVIDKNGRPYEAFRFTNNTWSGFSDVLKDARQPGGGGLVVPPELVATSSASMPNGDVHIVVVAKDGRPYEAFRFPNSTWSGFSDVLKDARQPGGGGLVVPPNLQAMEQSMLHHVTLPGQSNSGCHLASTSCYGILQWCHYACVMPDSDSNSLCGGCIGISF